MPASTAIGYRNRYLCWNSVGSVTTRPDGLHVVVEVEFNSPKRRSVRFFDKMDLVLGALGEECAIFASVGG